MAAPREGQSWLPTGQPPRKAWIDCPQNLPKVAQDSAPPKKNVCFVNIFVTINMQIFSLIIWCPSFEPLPKWGAMKSPNEGRPHDAPRRETAQCTEHSRSAHAEPDYRQASTRNNWWFQPLPYVCTYVCNAMYVCVLCVCVQCVCVLRVCVLRLCICMCTYTIVYIIYNLM